MPKGKEKSIGVSTSTLSLLKEWQKELRAKSLEETIRLSIGWSRSFNSNFLVSQVELSEKLKKLEGSVKSNSGSISFLLSYVKALEKKLEKSD